MQRIFLKSSFLKFPHDGCSIRSWDKEGLPQYQRRNFTIESILHAKWKIKHFHFLDAYQKILSLIFYISIETLSSKSSCKFLSLCLIHIAHYM